MKISWNINPTEYQALLKKSVFIPTNNIRMENFSRKYTGNESVSSLFTLKSPELLFLGGSITTGYDPAGKTKYSYPTLIVEYLKDLFHNSNMKVHNLSYPSFHSILGLSMLEQHKSNISPDIAFLEYAVNNGGEMEYIASFEGIVQKLLSYYPDISIVIISVMNKIGYTCEPYMKEIAAYYQFPHVSISETIKCFPDYRLSWENYTDDLGHPNQEGHIFLSDCITYIIKTTFDTLLENNKTALHSNKPNTFALSSYHNDNKGCFSNLFTTIQYYDASKMPNLVLGDFVPALTHPMFPCGIALSGKNNAPCIIKVHCKKLFLIFEQSNNRKKQGKLHVKVSPIGNEYYIDSYSIYSWGNPVTFPLIDGIKTIDYTICLKRMDSSLKKEFHILGFLFIY